jgi:hypothetical protein
MRKKVIHLVLKDGVALARNYVGASFVNMPIFFGKIKFYLLRPSKNKKFFSIINYFLV